MPEKSHKFTYLIDFKNCLSFAFIQALPYIRNSRVGICFPDFSIHFAFADQICKLFSIARIRVSLTILCLLKTLEIIHKTVCVLSSTPWSLSTSLIQKFHLSLSLKKWNTLSTSSEQLKLFWNLKIIFEF